MDKDVREIFSVAVRMWAAVTCMVGLLALLCLMCGCRTARYVPVETVRTEHVDRVKVERVTDSVSNDRLVYLKGDTVYIREWRDRWRTEVRTDTVVSVRVDSVAVPVPVEKIVEVERKPTWWERVKDIVGGVVIFAGLLWGLGWVIRRKFSRL